MGLSSLPGLSPICGGHKDMSVDGGNENIYQNCDKLVVAVNTAICHIPIKRKSKLVRIVNG